MSRIGLPHISQEVLPNDRYVCGIVYVTSGSNLSQEKNLHALQSTSLQGPLHVFPMLMALSNMKEKNTRFPYSNNKNTKNTKMTSLKFHSSNLRCFLSVCTRTKYICCGNIFFFVSQKQKLFLIFFSNILFQQQLFHRLSAKETMLTTFQGSAVWTF